MTEGRKNEPTLISRHSVIGFFALNILISWGGVLIIVLPTGIPGSGEDLERLYGPVVLPMLAGPFLSAFIVAALTSGRAGLGRLLKGLAVWRAKPVEYAVAVLLIRACALVVLLSLSALSPDYTPKFLSPDAKLQTTVLFLAFGFLIGLIEETGWTGFATPKLLYNRSVIQVGIGLGIIHGFWHLLVVIWQSGTELGILTIPFFVTLWLFALVAIRVLIVWVFARTRSILLAAVIHASHTGCLYAIWPSATTPTQDVIWSGLFASVGLAATLSVVFFFPATDLKRSRVV